MAVPPVIALEIGTSKVVALVGEMREDGQIMITGMGEQPSTGVRKSEVVDLESAVIGAKTALSIAEETGRVEIHEVHMAISGGHIESKMNKGTLPLVSGDREISEHDVNEVMDLARAVNLSPEREILHSLCRHFLIDDDQLVVRPEGMEGAKLSLNMLLLHGVRSRIRNTVKVAESIPIHVADVVFGGLCSAWAVMTRELKKSGVVVIDLGGGTTDYAMFADDVICNAGSLGVGGDHITNDIAMAFTIPIAQAESLKRNSAGAIIKAANALQKIAMPAEVGFPGRVVRVKDLYAVVNARAEEILRMVKDRLSDQVLSRIGGGIVLTGGGARLDGMAGLAEKVFGMPCSIGQGRHVSGLDIAANGPEYAACSGLIQYAFQHVRGPRRRPAIRNLLKSILGG